MSKYIDVTGMPGMPNGPEVAKVYLVPRDEPLPMKPMDPEPIDLTKLPELAIRNLDRPVSAFEGGRAHEYARLLPWMQAKMDENEQLQQQLADRFSGRLLNEKIAEVKQLQQQVQVLREAVKMAQTALYQLGLKSDDYWMVELSAALVATQPAGGQRRGLDLPALEAKLDAALESETAESLNEFLDSRAGGSHA